MVEMGETDDAQLPFGLKVAQDMRQGDGIGSPRKRYDDVGIATGQPVAADELSNALEQLHHSGLEKLEGLRQAVSNDPALPAPPAFPARLA
jgi:hypothetical protein